MCPSIFSTGLRLLEKIVHYVEQVLPITDVDAEAHEPRTENPVSEYLAAFGRRFYRELPSVEAAVAAYPLLWKAAPDDFFTKYFWAPRPVSSTLGEAMLSRTVNLDKAEFAIFLRKHNIVETFVKRVRCADMDAAVIIPGNPKACAGEGWPYWWTNPFILELVRFISKRKKSQPSGERGIEIALTDDEKNVWEQFSEIIYLYVLDYFDHIREWKVLARNA
jgi:hypothetical protein